MPNLFNKKILKRRIENYSIENINEKINKIRNWQKNLGNMKGLNEKRLQSAFLRAIFEDVLGYKNAPQTNNWTMDIECSTDLDSKTPDGILGNYKRENGEEKKDHWAVIELKGPQIPLEKDQKRKGSTYKSPVDQGFSYTNRLDKCRWVIVSNFTEIRLYQVGRSKEHYEIFYLNELDEIENFKKFYYLFSKENLISKKSKSQTLELTEATQKRHEDISVDFYNLYKNTRINLFEHLKEHNQDINPEILLEKSQKFLDRIIFICFCEDKGLLPNDLLHNAIKQAKESFSPSETPVWDQLRGVFRGVDKGDSNHNINAYNGGLFEYDKILDELVIQDEFFNSIYDISDYDFDSDVDVNILGHIFEQSITDIEKLKSDIKDNDYDKNDSRRKKEGIYYTPQYITSYIVENAVGGYLEDIKEELGYYDLPDIKEAGSDSWKTRYTKQHLEFYNEYEKRLKDIKILDPACGSGAFLNQAFDYLLEEHKWLNKQRDLLKGGQSSIYALDSVQRNILKDNIYGVDLNDESVEITKLSLWLKTANKHKPLTNLDDNIKHGNSLIDDPEVAGNKAFDWEEEFNEIMKNGGFDVVVGNPPYVRFEYLSKEKIKYYKKIYKTAKKQFDLFNIMLEKGVSLLKESGYIGFIIPSLFLKGIQYKQLRKLILNKSKINIIHEYGDGVFEDVKMPTTVIILNKCYDKNKRNSNEFEYIKEIKLNKKQKNIYSQENFIKNKDYLFNLSINVNAQLILDKIENNNYKLKNILNITRGLELGKKHEGIKENEFNNSQKLLSGEDIDRYLIKNIKYISKITLKKHSKNKEIFTNNKIMIRETGNKIVSTFDSTGKLTLRTLYNMWLKNNKSEKYNLKYFLGIINSKLIQYFYSLKYRSNTNVFPKIRISQVKEIPIAISNLKIQNQLVSLVANLLNLKKKEHNYKNKKFVNILSRYSSDFGSIISVIIDKSSFNNKIYTGRARKVRKFTVNINTNIVTLYSEKSSSGKYELLKFEEDDKYKRKYIKYYLENLNEDKLEEINENHSGNLLKRVLQIEIPDYNKDHVVKKVVKEWENIQQEIKELEKEIEKTDKEIDQMVYNLYDLTDEEIEIVEENID